MRFLIILILFFLIPVSNVYAQDVVVSSKNNYEIKESGNTRVTHDITITNLTSEVYVSDFVLNLHGSKPANIYASENSIPLDVSIIEQDSKNALIATFTKKSLGQGTAKEFRIEYDLANVATKSGDVWEIKIPKLLEENVFDIYDTTISVPDSFGEEAFLDPEPLIYEKVDGQNVYHFDRDQLIQSPISGAFGNFQSYNLNLTYHLENPLNQKTKANIALPPDTDYQKVFFQKIETIPSSIETDSDGNWIASIELEPREQKDVKVILRVDIFPVSRNLIKPSSEYLDSLMESNQYWNFSDLNEVPEGLNSPESIYDFVITKLNYDYEKIGTLTKRLGSKAIYTPDNAICTDFSDLTITLLRKAGIPAREIQGYAYSTSSEKEPISLVEDVLHSWVEYWDTNRQMWVQIDPTWGQTSGEDYLNSFDLKHITFVRHGTDPLKPYPSGSYNYGTTPQKDVSVSIEQIETTSQESTDLIVNKSHNLPFLPSTLSITATNTGTSAIYGNKIKIYHDQELVIQKDVPILLPYSSYDTEVEMPFSLSADQIPDRVRVEFAKEVVDISTNKKGAIYLNITAVLLFLLTILMFLAFKARHIRK